MQEEEIAEFQKAIEEQLDKKVLPISAASGKNMKEFKEILWELKLKGEEMQKNE